MTFFFFFERMWTLGLWVKKKKKTVERLMVYLSKDMEGSGPE